MTILVKNNAVRTVGVAIAIPDPWGEELQERRAAYGDALAWTIPTHVTLLPPTQVPGQRIDAVDRHLAEVARYAEGFVMELGGVASFRPVTPTVYLTLQKGAEECVRLADQTRSGPLRRRLPFPYHPHVTLAFDVPDEQLDRAVAENDTVSMSFAVAHFTRYELGPDGVWLPERDFALAT
ncbi:MAG TPA: 2'-5' RNA ligase family protein [Actinomycetes bacterium]|nr:2'-5' RNA ligase family protein [Actinomycetes bacterium]